jgi:hypothetical protein
MELITKDSRGGVIFPLVHILNRRPGETKDDAVSEGFLDVRKHLTKGGAVSFINDDDSPFGDNFNDISLFNVFGVLRNITKLLD